MNEEIALCSFAWKLLSLSMTTSIDITRFKVMRKVWGFFSRDTLRCFPNQKGARFREAIRTGATSANIAFNGGEKTHDCRHTRSARALHGLRWGVIRKLGTHLIFKCLVIDRTGGEKLRILHTWFASHKTISYLWYKCISFTFYFEISPPIYNIHLVLLLCGDDYAVFYGSVFLPYRDVSYLWYSSCFVFYPSNQLSMAFILFCYLAVPRCQLFMAYTPCFVFVLSYRGDSYLLKYFLLQLKLQNLFNFTFISVLFLAA